MSAPALRICLASIGLPHDGATLSERSLGGSETAAILVAEALARRGHEVSVYAPLPERKNAQGQLVADRLMRGVTWRPLERFQQDAVALPHDVTIISRDLNLLRPTYTAPIKVFWCHDLAIKRIRQHVAPCCWHTDALYVLSAFQRQQYAEVYGIADDAMLVTRNGIDPSGFAGLLNLKRDPQKLVYGSRPERGLEAALAVMDELQRRGSPFRLEISGYDAPGLAPQYQQHYANLFQQAAQRPNVRVLGPLTQAQWREQLATARAMLYPGCIGDFREISCIVAMEAQACGTPVVSIAKGAIPETLNGGTLFGDTLAGVLVGDETTEPSAPAYHREFADAVEALCADEVRWQRLHQQGLANAARLTWDGVAEQWETDWLARFDRRNDTAWRVERHAVRIGDRDLVGVAV